MNGRLINNITLLQLFIFILNIVKSSETGGIYRLST